MDPELDPRGPPFLHHYLEILQALALVQPRSCQPTPLLENASVFRQDMLELGEAMGLRLLAIPEGMSEESELRAFHLRSQMMLQTTAIRNWAHVHQMERVAVEVAGRVAGSLKAHWGH